MIAIPAPSLWTPRAGPWWRLPRLDHFMAHLKKGASGHLLKTSTGHLAKSCASAGEATWTVTISGWAMCTCFGGNRSGGGTSPWETGTGDHYATRYEPTGTMNAIFHFTNTTDPPVLPEISTFSNSSPPLTMATVWSHATCIDLLNNEGTFTNVSETITGELDIDGSGEPASLLMRYLSSWTKLDPDTGNTETRSTDFSVFYAISGITSTGVDEWEADNQHTFDCMANETFSGEGYFGGPDAVAHITRGTGTPNTWE